MTDLERYTAITCGVIGACNAHGQPVCTHIVLALVTGTDRALREAGVDVGESPVALAGRTQRIVINTLRSGVADRLFNHVCTPPTTH